MKILNGRARALLIGGAIGVSAFAFVPGAWSADDSPTPATPAAETPPAAGTPQAAPPAGINDQGQGQPAGQDNSANRPANSAQQPTSASTTTEASLTVTAIDRAARRVTLKDPSGEKSVISVPDNIQGFDTLKVGDKIDIDYYESVAVSILPPGTKPSATETMVKIPEGPEGGAIGKSLTVSARVVNIDPEAHEVTFKGPKGQTKTVKVTDPDMQKKMTNLKAGDVVQLTYTEATAAAIRPAAEK